MKTTKRCVLTKIYNEFKFKINEIVDIKTIFPDLTSVNQLEDVVFYINYYFINKKQTKEVIIDLLKINKIVISEDQLENIVIIVDEFLDIFQKI